MPKNIRCTSCNATLLAFEALGPTPIDHDECPECEGTNFEFVD